MKPATPDEISLRYNRSINLMLWLVLTELMMSMVASGSGDIYLSVSHQPTPEEQRRYEAECKRRYEAAAVARAEQDRLEVCNSDTGDNICAATGLHFTDPERSWDITCDHCAKTFCGAHLVGGDCYYDDSHSVCRTCAVTTCPTHRIIYYDDGKRRGNYYVDGGDQGRCVECLRDSMVSTN